MAWNKNHNRIEIHLAMRVINTWKQSIRALAVNVNLKICNIKAHAFAETQRIGSMGASEVFAHYIANRNEFSTDKELQRFMDFYANHWRLSSSQWSQDIFAMYATNMKRNGDYLEIGGADGFTHSNTYSLEKNLNWRGWLSSPTKNNSNS